ncbi:hypothetical protein GE061_015403 [Apolygus lucorum]|uniref:Uncharacterized protein n=1 Tax=Apolygus lucorum TaxID=248454 RepID=A0A8S9XPX5_APOLU|nr:hypothetical protein GE061_015403 [Apolygus lucorum]
MCGARQMLATWRIFVSFEVGQKTDSALSIPKHQYLAFAKRPSTPLGNWRTSAQCLANAECVERALHITDITHL